MSGLVTNLEDRIYRKRWRKILARMSSPSVENVDDQRQSPHLVAAVEFF